MRSSASAAAPDSARLAATRSRIPAPVRNRDRLIGLGEPVLPRYERVPSRRRYSRRRVSRSRPSFALATPLLNAVLDIMLERYRDLLRRGTALFS